ncbi:MAG: hypothetical protein V7L01_07640 [Nostoc sp.]|uniref:hypothetical protein n=1 Tax=Nostoc sp. TaxID=1180 RepID=UPI002FFD00CF
MVHLKDFSLVSCEIQSGEVLKAIDTIPTSAIEQASARSIIRTVVEEHKRSLSVQLVVSLVITTSFWSRDSCRMYLKT